MSTDATVACPNCGTDIKLTESLAAPLIKATRDEFEKRMTLQSAEVAKRKQGMKAREEELAKQRDAVEATVAQKLQAERDKLAADAAKREQAMKDREASLARERETLDASVAKELKTERIRIAAEEAKKAKQALGDDLEQKAREWSNCRPCSRRGTRRSRR